MTIDARFVQSMAAVAVPSTTWEYEENGIAQGTICGKLKYWHIKHAFFIAHTLVQGTCSLIVQNILVACTNVKKP